LQGKQLSARAVLARAFLFLEVSMFVRSFLGAALLAATALAGPPLTTVQDVLYKADGTRFNGTLSIAWNSFQAVDRSAIVTQSTSVKVVDGNLRVQLVPTTTATPAVYYSVTYNSDGRVQFRETWAVPSSAQALRVRDVRIAAPASAAQAPAESASGPIDESDVVGLIADLGVRPTKGPGYAAGRVALVNATGALESVTGSASDCVRVDGSSGPCGGSAPAFVDGDSPAGIVDGANTVFSLSSMPDPISSLAVYRNGLLQKPGQDFNLNGRNLQFVALAVPQPGDTLLASYRLSGGEADAPLVFPNAQVLCSGMGASTNATTLQSIGVCTIPAGILAAGDRLAVQFDLAHQGSAAGFSFELRWGATTALHRDAAPGDLLATGRLDAGLTTAGAQLSAQSWGTLLPLAATVATAADGFAGGLTIDFQAAAGQTQEIVSLRNFTVLRFP
jgi:hypothetical protein